LNILRLHQNQGHDLADIAFYQLQSRTAQQVLPRLLQKTRAADKTARVIAPDDLLTEISMAIWSDQADSWLPHGIAGRDDEDRSLCPIWIAGHDANDTDNDADVASDFHFYLADRMPSDAMVSGENTPAPRIFILFNGNDDALLSTSREAWKHWAKQGHSLSYYQHDATQGWVKKA
jgi:DNA polymerase-3 subunit chi